MTCTLAGVTFELVERHGGFEWLFPNGSETGLKRPTREAARRAMMYHATSLVSQCPA